MTTIRSLVINYLRFDNASLIFVSSLVRLQFESFFGQFGDFVTLATEVLRTRAKLDSSLVDARLQLDKLLGKF